MLTYFAKANIEDILKIVGRSLPVYHAVGLGFEPASFCVKFACRPVSTLVLPKLLLTIQTHCP